MLSIGWDKGIFTYRNYAEVLIVRAIHGLPLQSPKEEQKEELENIKIFLNKSNYFLRMAQMWTMPRCLHHF